MTAGLIGCGIYLALAAFLYHAYIREKASPAHKGIPIAVIAVIALGLRLAVSFVSRGYAYDMSCFRSWSAVMARVRPWDFYSAIDCDYAPGYLYVLGFLGHIKNLLGDISQNAYDALIKLPANLADIGAGLFIYFAAKRSLGRRGAASALAALYMLCPAAILNSAVWGQTDGILALIMLVSLYRLSEERYIKSAVWFAAAVTVKMQALIFAPIFLFVFADKLRKTKNKKLFGTLAMCTGAAAATVLAICLPFIIKQEPLFLYRLYRDTTGQYPYASLNAFGFFSMLGKNLESADGMLYFMSYKAWGTFFIAACVVLVGYLFLRGRAKARIFYCAGLLMSLVFVFSTEMHERYLFPAIVLFLMAYVCGKDKKTLLIAGGIALSQAVNVGYLYYLTGREVYHFPPDDIILILGSLLTLALAVYAVCHYVSLYLPERRQTTEIKETGSGKITRRDALIMSVAMLAYGILAFINLGDSAAPQTRIPQGEPQRVAFVLEEETEIASIIYYKGLGSGSIAIGASKDNITWEKAASEELGKCFSWHRVEMDTEAGYMSVEIFSEDAEVFEIGVVDASGRLLRVNAPKSGLLDEQELVPEAITYLNSTYFDEIYHARTAYENIGGIYPYEVSHPPLGKLIISAGIRMFGMNPFGWRFMGTVFGILMLPLMYLFAKRMFKSTFFAACAMLLLTFDFMHFAQTRIATIDSFSVFFIILMYYLMYIYYENPALSLKKTLLTLAACGMAFGLGIASKWICVYAGIGLAVLFAVATVRRERHRLKICFCCIGFFIIVPAAIYFASYAPYFAADSTRGAFEIFWENQKFMLSYHGGLTETHPFGSYWYEWPAAVRPIWYYGAKEGVAQGKVSSIVSFGNPLIWWTGTVAAIALLITRHNKEKTPQFIFTAFLSQFVPWILISRVVFIYHYFASVPFIILALVYLLQRHPRGRYIAIAFAMLAGILFIMFYPVLSGMEVSKAYVDNVLSWFNSWTLSY